MSEDENPPRPVNFLLEPLKAHRIYRVALGYIVGAWAGLQVAAIVLPGFGAPPWVLRGLMILLALGFGAALLAGWGYDRRASGRPLVPRALQGRLAWALTALFPAAAVTIFFLLRPLPRAAVSVQAAAAPIASAAPAAFVVSEKSIAVLPFDNFSEDKDSAIFADGVQDEVLTDLAKVADLKVISRSSVMQYRKADSRNLREIGRALGVAHVVEGSVQRAGNKIRVTAQLIDARTDVHQWAEHYDRDLADVFAIQTEIAQNIAGQLQAAISPQEHAAMADVPTHDLKAYELYLKARDIWNSENSGTLRDWCDRMLLLLTEATQRDPDFARAFAFMAEVQGIVYYAFETTPAQDAVVHHLAETVARLRPGSADAHRAMGAYAFIVHDDYRLAHEEYSQAVRLAPNDASALYWLASTDRYQGFWEDSVAHFQKAYELDPEDSHVWEDYVRTLRALRHYPEALAFLDRRIAGHTQDTGVPTVMKARLALEWKADIQGARATLATLPPSSGPLEDVTCLRLACDFYARDFAAAERDLAACPLDEIADEPRAMWRGRIARYRGDKAAAERAFTDARPVLAAKIRARPTEASRLITLAKADAALGRKQEALSEARRATAMRPLEQDAWDGPELAAGLAVVLAWTGEREEAIGTLQTLRARPHGPDYGSLRWHPDWDALRGDPRFEAMVASLAPKP